MYSRCTPGVLLVYSGLLRTTPDCSGLLRTAPDYSGTTPCVLRVYSGLLRVHSGCTPGVLRCTPGCSGLLRPEAGNGLSPEATVRVRGDHIPDVNKEHTQDPAPSTKESTSSHSQRRKSGRGGSAHMDRAPTPPRGTHISKVVILAASSSMVTRPHHDGLRRG